MMPRDSFSERLRRACTARGYGHSEAMRAVAAVVAPGTFKSWWSGRRTPPEPTQRVVLDYIGGLPRLTLPSELRGWTLDEVLHAALQAGHVTQAELAARLDITERTLRRYLGGGMPRTTSSTLQIMRAAWRITQDAKAAARDAVLPDGRPDDDAHA